MIGLSGCRLALRLRLALLDLGRSLPDALVDLVRKLLEILDKQIDELRRRRIIFRRIRPCAARVEKLGAALQLDRHFETEVRVLAELAALQAPVERGVQ